MRIEFLFAAFLACCLSIQPALKVHPQANQTGEANQALWNVVIVRASQPTKVEVVGGALYGRGGTPPAKHQWLQLHVQLTPPKAGHSVSLKNLAVVDESSVYQAQAIANVKPGPAFSFFGDATKRDFTGRTLAGFGLLDAQGDMSVAVVDAGGTRGMVMAMQKREAVGVLLLFAVPTAATTLYFTIEDGQRIPIRLPARN